jgi:hypothetical protein
MIVCLDGRKINKRQGEAAPKKGVDSKREKKKKKQYRTMNSAAKSPSPSPLTLSSSSMP